MARSSPLLLIASLVVVACGEHQGPGTITGQRRSADAVAAGTAAQRATALPLSVGSAAEGGTTAGAPKQILFGDLHVHTTFSADAYMMSLPILQGEGAHPIADACDFARHCSGLDFWSITDHAEALTPRRWRETKESVRQCNAVAGDGADPDLVTFLGWEWTQIGRTPEEHYGHKNVIFRDVADDQVPRRPIYARSFSSTAMRVRPPFLTRWAPVVLDWPNRQYYLDMQLFQEELRDVPECPEGVETTELPDECLEGAATPAELFTKLGEWGFPSLVIPHGTTWGLYTPPGSSWDKQLRGPQHDPTRQTIIEVFSGHGNSEEYRDWRAVERTPAGDATCPEPRDGHEPCCWRAGEIIRSRCDDPTSALCEERVRTARRNFVAAGVMGRHTVPGTETADWVDCDTCPDCYLPAMNYRPASSVQYTLALSNFDTPAPPRRFHFGFIASSDNHRARPGTGYKEYDRLANTEAAGARDEGWLRRIRPPNEDPSPESVAYDPATSNLMPYQALDFERQASFFMTGGLAAVHATGRSRDAIWDALQRREVYGTSGPRILLWFDLLNGPTGTVPMGGRATLEEAPRFRVRAAGAFEQKPGCPPDSEAGLSPDRLEKLCRGECHHPGDTRLPIRRIEVVRIRPQKEAGEAVGPLIEDPWLTLVCPDDPTGCVVGFEDREFAEASRDTVYYVRAIQGEAPAVNAAALRCKRRNDAGRCEEVAPCYGDFRTARDDDCLAPNEERAWSSPLYVDARG